MTAMESPTEEVLERASLAVAREGSLIEWLRQAGSVAIGYSGGVDSTYLAAVAVATLGAEHVVAIIGRSASYPEAQWIAARASADRIGVPVIEVETGELEDPRYAANPTNRCYFCKSELWSRLAPVARERGMARVVDGTNADDLTDHRPGAAAAREAGVRSPLAEVGFRKSEIRDRLRARGLDAWSAPSSPCLSSRIPYGTPVTRGMLSRIERAEAGLRALGIEGDMRVRAHDALARVELDASTLDRWLQPGNVERIVATVRSSGFERVAIDLRGFRSGSLNVLEGVTAA